MMQPNHVISPFRFWLILIALVLTGSFLTTTAIFHVLNIDIIIHMFIYSVLSFLPMIIFRKRKTALLLSLAVAPLSFFFELLHGYESGWGFEWLDAFANNIGIMIGITVGLLVRLKKHFENESAEINALQENSITHHKL
jgi:hypothetical protein